MNKRDASSVNTVIVAALISFAINLAFRYHLKIQNALNFFLLLEFVSRK
jgi:hypothetical protein